MIRSDIETLLREDAWMRRIARGLLRNPHDAEDAVQDAWLADLEGAAPARAERRRGWLRGVLWNRASARTRTERRQRERAEDAARGAPGGEAPPAADDAQVRDLRRAIAEAVLELDEPLRETVHLTYFAGLSLAEVAARTDVSKTAAKKRLDRALEHLRRSLDAYHGGDRRAWSLGLATFLGLDTPPLAAAASTPEPEPRLAMRQPELLAAAAVVVTAVASLSFLGGSPGPVTPTPARVAPDPGSAAPSVAAAPTATTRTSPPPAPAQAAEVPPEATIRARFLLPDGSPAVGCEWSLSGRAANRERTEQFGLPADWSDLAGVTDSDGRLEITFVPPPAYSFRLRLEHPGFADERWWFYECRRGSTTDFGTFELVPESSLTVRLVDGEGLPVTSGAASVHVVGESDISFSVRSSVRRHVRIEHGASSAVATGLAADRYEVRVNGPTVGQSNDVFVSLDAGESRTLDVVVEAPASTPPPIAGQAPVRIAFSNRHQFQFVRPAVEWIVVTDANGGSVELSDGGREFGPFMTVGELAPPLSIAVDDPRFEPWTIPDVAPGAEVEARLEGSAALRLDVRAPDGTPLEDYEVRVGGTTTTADPSWDLPSGPGAPPGGLIEGLVADEPLRLSVTTPTLAAVVDVAGPIGGAVTDLTVPLEPRFTVSGRVTDPGGAPAAYEDVYLVQPAEVDDSNESRLFVGRPNRIPATARMALASTQTDGAGRYTLEVPGPGAYRLLASNGAGVQSWSDEIELVETASADDLVLPRGAVLRGRVELPEGIDPRRLILRTELESDGVVQPAGHPTPDSRGWFEFRGLPAEEVKVFLQVERRSFGPIAGLAPICVAELEEGEVRSLDLAGAPGTPGLLRLSLSGVPAGSEGTTFWIGRPDSRGWSSLTFGHRVNEGATAAAPLPMEPGAWTVQAFGPDWAASTLTAVDLAPGAALDVALDLELLRRAFSIEVGGQALSGAKVIVTRTDVSKPADAPFETDGDGGLSLALEAGEYTVRAWVLDAPGGGARWVSAEVTWPVEDGAVIELD